MVQLRTKLDYVKVLIELKGFFSLLASLVASHENLHIRKHIGKGHVRNLFEPNLHFF